MADLILSEKYKAFLRCTAPVEFLEGTTAAGKTTVGLFKFMLRVAESRQRLHVLAGLDQGTVEKNIITKELGILDDFGDMVEYYPQGGGDDRMAHLILHTSGGDKKIYVLGYADKARWKKALASSAFLRATETVMYLSWIRLLLSAARAVRIRLYSSR